MKAILQRLSDHQTLSRQDARDVLVQIASGQVNNSQVSAFMTIYLMRNVTLPELEGFRDAMLELCVPVAVDRPVIDVCGTGGDGKNTFNISTLAGFVVAAAGQAVAKHGNYGVSSVSGSSNVLEFLGYRFTNDRDELSRSLDEANLLFMHAPLFHPAMKNVAPIRKELGVKTFFNMLGPMVNPAQPINQFAGVFSLELARQYAYLYQKLAKRFTILHDLAGYDEVSLTGGCKIFTENGERILFPEALGFPLIEPAQIAGGRSVEESARLFLDVLNNTGTPAQQQVVVANAALALQCARQIPLDEAVARATEALVSGEARKRFNRFMDINRKSS
ncbi:MAG: anthranilate phosphoribosyltransferase [Cyclobacteriaceae bacterium]|jgi:anthranilate phosphoribosyltransferase